MFQSAKSGLKGGSIASLALLFIILSGAVLVSLDAYEGHCISFEPPIEPCSLTEFFFPYLLIFIVYSVLGRPTLSLTILVILLAFPLAGFLFGNRAERRNQQAGAGQDQPGD